MTDPKDLGRKDTDLKFQAEAKLKEEAEEPEELAPGAAAALIRTLRLQKRELELENQRLRHDLQAWGGRPPNPEHRTEALSQTQSRVLENMAEGVALTDASGILVYTNPAFDRMFGYDPGELLGQHSSRLNYEPPQDTEPFIKEVLRQVRATGIWRGEFHNVRKDGSGFFSLAHISSLEVEGKKLLISLQEDITERKRADQALARQQELLQGIIDNIPVMLTIYDPDIKIFRFNQAFRELLGWTEADMSAADPMELFYPDAAYRRQVRGYMQSLEPGWRDFQVTTKDGGVVDSTWANIRLPGGTHIGIGVDIRERKQAEESLRLSNRRLDLLAGTAGQLLASHNPIRLVEPLCREVMDFLDCDVFFNFLHDTATQRLHLHAYAGISPAEAVGIEWLDFGAGVCGCAAQGRCRVLSEDIQAGHDDSAALVRSFGVQAYACHPLLAEGRLLGTLSFGTRRRRMFTEDELALMKAVADQVAMALDRQLAEAALEESERRFRRLVESIPQLVWTCTAAGTCDFLSKQWLDFTGTPEAEQLQYDWLNQVHPEDRGRLMAAWRKSVADGSPFNQEFRIRRHDGVYLWFDTRAVPWTDDQGRVVKWFGTNTDITERKQTEAALKESEARYRSLFMNNHTIMLLIDPETGAIIDANPAASNYYGYPRRELLTKKITDINISPGTRVRTAMQAAKGFQRQQFHFEHRLAGGEVRPVEVFSGPIVIRGRKLLYSIVQDITERQKALEALRESEERYRRLVQLSPDAILVHQQRRYVFANQAAATIFGAPGPKELLGREVFDLVHPDCQGLVQKRLDLVSAGRPTPLQEVKILRLNGQAVDVEATAVPIEYQGEPAVQVILRDISERKRAEAEIRHLASFPQLNPNPVLEIDAHGVFTFANKASKEILEKLGPETSLENFLPADWEELQRIADQGGERLFSREIKIGGAFFSATIVFIEHLQAWRLYMNEITGQKQVEAALRQERDFNAALLDTLGALVIVLDRDGRIVHFNKACEANSGYTFAEVQGKLFFDIFLMPEEKQAVKEIFKNLKAGDVPNNHENHWLARSGKKILISWSNTSLRDADGQVTYVIGTGIDITGQRQAEEAVRRAHEELERRVLSRTEQLRHTVDKLLLEIAERERAEAKLRASEARFAAFMRHLPGSAIMRDRGGRFLFVNESWEKILGRRPGESLGKTVFDFWPPEIAGRLQAIDQEVFRQNKPIESRVELPVAGKSRTYMSYRFPIPGDTGQVEMVGAIGIDITERLKAEETRDRLIEILEATPDFVGSADREGHLFYLNRAAREMLGLTDTDIIAGMTFANTHPAWAVDLVLREGRPVYAREGSWRGETAILRRDGVEIPVSQVILAHRTPEGRIKFFSTICRDISARKQAEERLRKSEEKLRLLTTQLLSAQEDERKRLAAELHDELGHALLTLKLQLRAVEQGLLPEQADLKDRMREIVTYLTDTVEEVRRLYHDLSPGDLEDLGLTTALHNMVEEFHEYYQDIEWHVELDEIDHFFALPIQTMIYRIIQEALTNIGKHAYPKHVTVKATREDGQVVFRIDDDGRGFALEEVLDGDPGTKGMGLAAMAQRVSLAGGDFDLWSRENQGSSITFRIPCTPEGEKA